MGAETDYCSLLTAYCSLQPFRDITLHPTPEIFEQLLHGRRDGRQLVFGEVFVVDRDAAAEHVKLDLRLGAARPHRDAAAIHELDRDHVLLWNLVALDVVESLGREVAHGRDRDAVD